LCSSHYLLSKGHFQHFKVPLCFFQSKQNPSSKWPSRFYLHLTAEVCSSSNNSTLTSVQKLFEITTYSIRQKNFVLDT
jgi:hypothetical protein